MTSAASTSEISAIEAQVLQIRTWVRNRDFLLAAESASALVAHAPENRDVLYLLALSQRNLNQIAEALQTLAQLQEHHPGFSRLYQERGHCYVALRDAPKAIEAFLWGVNINPALPASWGMLEGLYRLTGQLENAVMAAEHVATLKKLPPDVMTATGFFCDGDWTLAENLIRAYLLKHGNHVEAMRLLARIGMARQVHDDAEYLLEAVLELAPDYRAARHDYARVLLERHKFAQARIHLDQLLKLDPNNSDYWTLYANALVGLGEYEQAIVLYRRFLETTPQAADVNLWLAHALKTQGQTQDAIASYRAAAAARPNFGDAYWSLANLKTYQFTDEEMQRMRLEEASSKTTLIDRYHLCFALGKACEDRGLYEESFVYYSRGSELKLTEVRYKPASIELNTSLQKSVCTESFFDSRRAYGAPEADPIFIVGLPRAGSTLLEQILASHSQVEGTQELAEIPRLVLEMLGRDYDLDNPRYPGILESMSESDFAELGRRYLRETKSYRSGKPFFIDKMPNNFRHIGLIHLMLPNAKIIDARREPMACCFSNFKQLFASGQEFTYGIENIARYYRTYLELMRHWNAVLPGRVLRVLHEDVVDDLESSVRRILDFCGLPFEPGCVEFYKTKRSVRTASSEQVRQPIFRGGLDQWTHFEPWLDPLKSALGDAISRYRD